MLLLPRYVVMGAAGLWWQTGYGDAGIPLRESLAESRGRDRYVRHGFTRLQVGLGRLTQSGDTFDAYRPHYAVCVMATHAGDQGVSQWAQKRDAWRVLTTDTRKNLGTQHPGDGQGSINIVSGISIALVIAEFPGRRIIPGHVNFRWRLRRRRRKRVL